jgi:hypothetical protein
MKSKLVVDEKVVDYTIYIFLQIGPLSSGAWPVLPMGVGPEAIPEIFQV